MTPEIGKKYRFTLQPLSPPYTVTSFANGNAICTPEGASGVCAVLTPDMWEHLKPVETKETN